MIDIHSHILFGVDDGAKTLEDSLNILKDMSEMGYDRVILTPHYIQDSNYSSSFKNNEAKLQILKEEVKKNNIDIDLYLGNEIYIDADIYDLLEKEEITSLNQSKYLLIELPLNGEFEDYQDILSFLIHKGYKVILAHPERYIAFQKNFNEIYELEKIGVYFQSNLESIIGHYGDEAKKMIIRLLKEKKVSILATDIHHQKKDYAKWKKAIKLVQKYVSKNEFHILVQENPEKIIENGEMNYELCWKSRGYRK